MYYIFLYFSLFLYTPILWATNSGFFFHIPIENAVHKAALFLPYNPTIFLVGDDAHCEPICHAIWPHATILKEASVSSHMPIDFIWIQAHENSNLSRSLLHRFCTNAKMLFISGTTRSHLHDLLQTWIIGSHLRLFSSWQQDDQLAFLFVPHYIYSSYMHSLSFDPQKFPLLQDSFPPQNIEQYFTPITEKNPQCALPPIDYIYMINLDERPEKFLSSIKQLHPYHIFPHRVSAVNGWKLSQQALSDIGVKLYDGMLSHQFLGSVFESHDGREYKTLQMIDTLGKTYFCAGMTRGAIGIVLSHLSILQDAYNAGHEIIWIMEDDIQVLHDPLEIPVLIHRLNHIDPNWDILFTDVNTKNQQGQYVVCQSLAMRPNVPIAPLDTYLIKSQRINKDFSSIGMRFGAYSMIIKRSGIEKILNYYKKHAIFLPYDADFWLDTSLHMYCTNKDIVSTIPDALSDNSQPTYTK